MVTVYFLYEMICYASVADYRKWSLSGGRALLVVTGTVGTATRTAAIAGDVAFRVKGCTPLFIKFAGYKKCAERKDQPEDNIFQH